VWEPRHIEVSVYFLRITEKGYLQYQGTLLSEDVLSSAFAHRWDGLIYSTPIGSFAPGLSFYRIMLTHLSFLFISL